MISRETVPRSRWPCIIPLKRARLELSQLWSALRSVVSRRFRIIWLIVSLSSATSPWASTPIERVRSPLVTAVDTAAIARTWSVRFEAIEFTESVRSRQVPETSSARESAAKWPRVPTSRATRVTLAAKEESWSTMVLSVDLSSRISPLASTVIFWERSPWATAVATWAMFLTWSVRFEAIEFTESVRSRQVPETSSTLAWPPSLPSVPTSLATRVTSPANERSWSTIVLIVSLSSSTSPFTSTVIFCERSPRATAVVTSAMLRTWVVSEEAMKLTDSVRSRQVPETPRTLAWPPSLPSVPTSRATRVTSSAKDESWSTIVLMVSLSWSTSPFTSTVICWERSPRATAVVTSAMFLTWSVRFEAMKFTESVRSRHVPETSSTLAWPPSLPLLLTYVATSVTSSANDGSWSTIVLMVSLS